MPRMSGRAAAIFLAMIALLWITLPRLRPATDDLSSVRDVDAQFDRASAKADIASLEHLVAGDFSTVDADGNQQTRAAVFDCIRTDPWKVESLRRENLQVQLDGDTAIVTGAEQILVRNASGGDRSGVYRFLHVFQKRDGRWLLIAGTGPRLSTP